ncbi:MAG: aminotransferase class V-fold PLP-dependent enzyme [Promethearchaeota archaeon]
MDFEFLRNEIIGNDFFYETPFGRRLLTYTDYTASGRSLKFIEKYLLYIQKSYANTHTEDDVTGRHMTRLLHKAEELIKKSLNAEKNCYIIPNGTGATGAIAKVQEILGIYIPSATKDRLNSLIDQFIEEDESKKKLIGDIKSYIEKKQPVIFVGPYEHHSNDIMWREALGEVIEIDLTPEGFLDLDDLEKKVSDPRYKDRYKIGSFSAASNVTGLMSPVYDVTRILHKYNAIACFDFAASGPYVKIDMNKDDESYLDAIFLSPHKFLGGPGSSGILVINKRLYRTDLAPTFAAGGTVDYVSSFAYDFSKDVETREKPGTPGVLQIIKAALSISLKDIIDIDKIEEKEREYIHRAFEYFSKNPNIQVLGNQDPDKRVAIFSLLIKHKNKYLHPKLATKLLNDLFGIQSRAGCSCAGPYGHRLLNIGTDLSMKYREVIESGCQSIKPGWLRVNFHYTMSEADFKFVCQAIDFIATNGYLFIPQYKMNIQTGMWSHKDFDEPEMKEPFGIEHLLKIDFEDCFTEKPINKEQEYEKYLNEAFRIAKEIKATYAEKKSIKYEDPKAEDLRYFYVNHME